MTDSGSRPLRPRVAMLTREYPPHVYGGAGVHVEYLARELAKRTEVEVHRFGVPADERDAGGFDDNAGDGRPGVRVHPPWQRLAGAGPFRSVLETLSVDLSMADGVAGVDVVHSHTWYANLAGHLAKLLHGIPHVATTHSLEPLRPWKASQLGAGGYRVSSFCERTALEAADAVVAVSAAMREDVLRCYPDVDAERVRVIHNGVDTDEYRPDPRTDLVRGLGVDPDRPSVVFVGRITRQKGIAHLLDAAREFRRDAQLVLCAGTPDTDEIGAETATKVASLRRERGGVVWIERMLPRAALVQLLSHASVFCCPSVYEPLGIVNLEAMACEAPVVASAVGGIPEVVEDGATGLLVPLDASGAAGAAADPATFASDIAERVNELLDHPERARGMGRAGRTRVLERFSWSRVAERTLDVYRDAARLANA